MAKNAKDKNIILQKNIDEAKIIIFDDIFPHPLSAFRIAEYNHYLSTYNNLKIVTNPIAFKYINEQRSFESIRQEYESLYPEHKEKVMHFTEIDNYKADFAYMIFNSNAYKYIEIIDREQIPFVFTLYPGGGFAINNRHSDKKLNRICASPNLKKIITTQTITKDYILEKNFIDESKVEFIYGGVLPSNIYAKNEIPKKVYNKDKNTFDICFVANKYMEKGIDKGYDLFIETAKQLVKKIKNIFFHVVGSFDNNDIDISEIKDRITFYGIQRTDFFPKFYAQMDIILSPNKPFILSDGAFDGFPTGCCIEAGLNGVAVFCTDILKLNHTFKEAEEIVIIQPNSNLISNKIMEYYLDTIKLSELANSGQKKMKLLFDLETQMKPRKKIISNVLEKIMLEKQILKPLVSVCMITYNHEKYIHQAIEGVLKQKTDFQIEIVIGEDSSTDKTRGICEKYAKHSDKIILLDSKIQHGMIANFQRTLKSGKGKYIALCEGDDYWTDSLKLQKQVDFLEANPNYAGCFTNCLSIEGNNLKQTELVQHSKNDFSQEDIPFYAPTLTLVFRNIHKMIESLDKMKDVPGGDLYLLTIIAKFGMIKFQNFVSAVYRIHAGGVWSGKSEFEKKIHLLKTRLAIFFIAETNTLKQKLISHMEVIYNDSNSIVSNSAEEKTLNELGDKLNQLKRKLVKLPEENSNNTQRVNMGYIIYGDDIINSGIIRNQVMPLLESLSQNYNYNVTIFSVIFPGFEYDSEKLDSFEKILQTKRINLQIVSSQGGGLEVASVVKKEIENKSISILHCRSYFSARLGLEIQQMIDVKVIFDVRGLFPEEQKLLSLLRNESSDNADKLFKELKGLEKDLVINSDATVSLNESFSNHLNSEHNEIQNLFEISNFVDLKKFQFSNEDRNRIRAEIGWLKNPIFVYSGAFSPWYDLKLLKNWIMSISKISIESRFLILNYSDINISIEPEVEILIELEKKLLNKIKIIKVDPDEMSCWLSASDIALIPHNKFFKTILKPAQPVKFGEFLANGLKFLALDYCKEISDFISENNGTGYLIKKPEEANNIITDLVASIHTESDVIARMERASLAEKYSLTKTSRKYVELYETLIINDKNLKIKLNILYQTEEHIEKGNLTSAEKIILELLKEDPSNIRALNNLSIIKILDNEYSEAEKIINEILQIDETNIVAKDNYEYLNEIVFETTKQEEFL